MQGGQALGVPNKQIPSGHESTNELGDEFLLCWSVKVDHDVPAEDNVKKFAERRLTFEQVELLKLDAVPQTGFRSEVSVLRSKAALKMSLHDVLRQPVDGFG